MCCWKLHYIVHCGTQVHLWCENGLYCALWHASAFMVLKCIILCIVACKCIYGVKTDYIVHCGMQCIYGVKTDYIVHCGTQVHLWCENGLYCALWHASTFMVLKWIILCIVACKCIYGVKTDYIVYCGTQMHLWC